MTKSNKFSPEARKRAVPTVQEHQGEFPWLWAAIEFIAPKVGCVPQTLHDRFGQIDVRRVQRGHNPNSKKLSPTKC